MSPSDRSPPDSTRFAVLPDRGDAYPAATWLAQPGAKIVRHSSGRPWLVGWWPEDDITVGEAGSTRIALIGPSSISTSELTRFAGRLRDLAELDQLARTLAGSFHLVGVLDGRIRVQGTAAGLRLVFHALMNGVTVAADRADLLAEAIEATPDQKQVALRLLWPVPHPLAEPSVWHGVHAVPPGEALLISPDGRETRRSRWWTPPEATQPLAEAAPRVRETLTDAVQTRTRVHDTVSCDFSGGIDSTSVCFLAAQTGSQVIASTWPGRDPGDTDLWWAEHAASFLPGVEHLIWPAEQAPLIYSGLLDIDDPLDEPTIGVLDRSRVIKHLPGLVGRGSTLHFTGLGGDHVAWCSEAYYHRLLRRRPWHAFQQLRGFRALWDWPLWPMVQALTDSRSYRRWLMGSTRRLHAPTDPPVTTALGWGMAPRLFHWVTEDAVQLAREAMVEAARSAEPLANDRGMHADLEQIRLCTRIVRHWDRMAERAGLPMASPFLDDRVVEACLATDPGERVTPWQFKPLLSEAMQGLVPESCLGRTTKAQAAMDTSVGLREHRGDLFTLWENSRLGELGLVDTDELKELAYRPDTPALRNAILYPTIAAEVWLRSHARKPAAGGVH